MNPQSKPNRQEMMNGISLWYSEILDCMVIVYPSILKQESFCWDGPWLDGAVNSSGVIIDYYWFLGWLHE